MNHLQKVSALASCRLFSMLDDRLLAQLANAGRETNVASGCTLLRKGEATHELHVIINGAVRLYLSSATGKEFCIAVVGRGMTIDVVGLLGSGGALMHSVATEPTTLLSLPMGVLGRIMGEQQRRESVLQYLIDQHMQLLGVLEDITLYSLDVRVARVLHRLHLLSANNPAARLHRLDQTTISSMANGTRSKVNAHLQSLRRMGAIDIHDGSIVMRRMDLLAAACYHPPMEESVP